MLLFTKALLFLSKSTYIIIFNHLQAEYKRRVYSSLAIGRQKDSISFYVFAYVLVEKQIINHCIEPAYDRSFNGKCHFHFKIILPFSSFCSKEILKRHRRLLNKFVMLSKAMLSLEKQQLNGMLDLDFSVKFIPRSYRPVINTFARCQA